MLDRKNCHIATVLAGIILAAGGMSAADVVHVSGYVTSREHMAGYMRARDAFLGQPTRLPSSTLLIVSGFTRPEFKVEVELWAARGDVV